jgi:polyisoprenoid-binding protein YceI
MKKLSVLFVLAFGSLALLAATLWQPTTGSVKFYIKNAGITVDGSLSGISASIKFDEKDLVNSSIYASVKTSSIKTGIDKRDEHLRGPEYFDAAKYPKIEMKSTAISKATNGYKATFDVTIKGKTKSIMVPFTFTSDGGTGKFVGSLSLNRLDFGVGESSMVLSNDVKVKITLNVKK